MAFQPFLANRAAVAPSRGGSSPSAASGGFRRLFDETAQAGPGEAAGSQNDGPKIDVIEENGRVASIVVTCRCCERIEIKCRY